MVPNRQQGLLRAHPFSIAVPVIRRLPEMAQRLVGLPFQRRTAGEKEMGRGPPRIQLDRGDPALRNRRFQRLTAVPEYAFRITPLQRRFPLLEKPDVPQVIG